MEFGTRVRGRYDVVARPDLIAMRWDFEDDDVPVPGGELPAYARFDATDRGCRVEVQQLADTADQAPFMEAAWGMVLGRLKTGVVAATDPDAVTPRRAPRPKRRSGSLGSS
jgi:uncharacterized protein YndB with AHSA1/START domain